MSVGLGSTVDEDLRWLVEGLEPSYAVDLGSGSGQSSLWLAAQGWSVSAVERDTELVLALERCAREHELESRIDVVREDLFTVELPPSLQLALLRHVHLRRWHRTELFGRLRRVLSPSCALAIVSLVVDGADVEKGEQALTTAATLEHDLKGAGFDVEKSRVRPRNPAPGEPREGLVVALLARPSL